MSLELTLGTLYSQAPTTALPWRTLSILTGLRGGRRGAIQGGAVVGDRPSGPSQPSAVSSASAVARSELARRLAAESCTAPMALWIECAARDASVSPGTCGEKRRRRDEHLHARAPPARQACVSCSTERVPTPAQRASRAVVWAPQRRASKARVHRRILAACAAARGRGEGEVGGGRGKGGGGRGKGEGGRGGRGLEGGGGG